MKKFSVNTSGGWRQSDMSLEEIASLVKLLSMDKQPGQSITFQITAQQEGPGQ